MPNDIEIEPDVEEIEEVEDDPEILSARHEVELAKAELHERLDGVARSGRKAWQGFQRGARPFLIGAALFAGAFIVVGTLRVVTRKRKATSIWLAPAEPSLLAKAVGTAARAAARAIAGRLAQRVATQLAEHVATGGLPKLHGATSVTYAVAAGEDSERLAQCVSNVAAK